MCLYDQTPYIGCPEGEQHFYRQWMRCNKAADNDGYCCLEKSAPVEQLRDFSGNVLCCPIHRHIAVHQHQFTLVQGDGSDAAGDADADLVDLAATLDGAIGKRPPCLARDKPRPPKIEVGLWSPPAGPPPSNPLKAKPHKPLSPKPEFGKQVEPDKTLEVETKLKTPSPSLPQTNFDLSSVDKPELEPASIARALIELPVRPRTAEPRISVARRRSNSELRQLASRPASSQGRPRRGESSASSQGRRFYGGESTDSALGRRAYRDQSAASTQRRHIHRAETPEPDFNEPARGRKPLRLPTLERRRAPNVGVVGLPSRPDIHRRSSITSRNTSNPGSTIDLPSTRADRRRGMCSPLVDTFAPSGPAGPTSLIPPRMSRRPSSRASSERGERQHMFHEQYAEPTQQCNDDDDARSEPAELDVPRRQVPPLCPSRPASADRYSGPPATNRRRAARDAARRNMDALGRESPTLGLSVHWDLPAPIANPVLAIAGPKRHMKRESDDSGYQSSHTRQASRDLPLRVDWEREKGRAREIEREVYVPPQAAIQPPPQQYYPQAALSPRPLPDAAYLPPVIVVEQKSLLGKKSMNKLRRTLSGLFSDGRRHPGQGLV